MVYPVLLSTSNINNYEVNQNNTHTCIGGGTGGAEGAKAPPVLKQQGLSPPRNSLQP